MEVLQLSQKNKGGFDNLLKDAYIKNAGVVEKQAIEKTLEINYMPYAMSVILSRALPQIDGFKPSHRKLLYTMFRMGLLDGKLTKSANVVGATMKLNPHGDSAIYETMVRMSRGNAALLHPYVESKGNFGKFFSRDMDCAASRYTEVKLAPICKELFSEIDSDAVDFVSNYDGSTTEPVLLPAKFPAILVNSNMGIAVSMASAICPFNLAEVCATAIKIVKGEQFDLLETLKGPDFPGGGLVVRNDEEFRKIYETGRGSFQLQSVFSFDKKSNCVEIVEIPYTTTVEAIIEKIVSLIKLGKLKEISDVRDETDLKGLKIAIDLKRGANFEEVKRKLLKLTPMQDSYSCNFNVLVDLVPMVMGIKEIVKSWQNFRQTCVKRRVNFDLQKKERKLHLIKGLNKILLDLDKAIEIIRKTELEVDVVKNLMAGFNIDKVQAEYIAEIKLRNLNKQYILNRVAERKNLEEDIENLRQIVASEQKINEIICLELEEIAKKYGVARKTRVVSFNSNDDLKNGEEKLVEDYEVKVVLTKQGYLKKIPLSSFRSNQIQKLKMDDSVVDLIDLHNTTRLVFFTSKARAYFSSLSQFENLKSSVLGEFIAAKLGFDDDESVIKAVPFDDYGGELLFFFENGKLAKISLEAYKTNRKKLNKAFCVDSNLCALFFQHVDEKEKFVLISSDGRWLVVDSSLFATKTTKTAAGVKLLKLKEGQFLVKVIKLEESGLVNFKKFVSRTFPAQGKKPTNEDLGNQLKLELKK